MQTEEKFQVIFLSFGAIFLLLVWIFIMESTNSLASASSAAVPSFSFSLSQENYDAKCCQDVADKICQQADAATEVMETS